MEKLIIFISGRGSNMKRIIEETKSGILKGHASVVLVFSDKKDAKGLGIAKEFNIPTSHISPKGKTKQEFNKELLSKLKQYEFDYIILAGYMRILSSEFVNQFPKQIINIHPADTQKHQGLNAYKWAFDSKLQSTKITVHYVDEGMDTGQIINQKTVDISSAKSLQEVEDIGIKSEHEFYSKVLLNLITKII